MIGFDRREVGVGRGLGVASTYLSLKTLRPLFSIAPMLKSDTATIMNTSRSYSRPNASSSQRIERFERVHGVAGAVLLAGLDVDAKRDLAAGHGDERVVDARRARRRPARTDRTASGTGSSQTAKWRPPASRRCRADCRWRAAPALRPCRPRCARGEDRQHVRPVEEIGDAAEALGLALRAVDAARPVKPGELGVGRRIDQRLDLQRERPMRRLRDGEAVRRRDIAVGRQRRAVDLERDQRQPFAVECQRGGRGSPRDWA